MEYLILSSGTQKAKKKHRCSCCQKIIKPGDTYSRWVGISDGEFSVYKCHNKTGHCGDNIVQDDEYGSYCDMCDIYV